MSRVSRTTADRRMLQVGAANGDGTAADAPRNVSALGSFSGYVRAVELIVKDPTPTSNAPPAEERKEEEKKDNNNQNGENSENKGEDVNTDNNKDEGEKPAEEEEEKAPEPECSGTLDSVTAWCAEQDGTISIRKGATGGLLTRTSERIQECGKTYVQCLHVVGPRVWCGYSDGTLRGYDVATKKLVYEKKKHNCSINSIVHVSVFNRLLNANQVLFFTASDDNKILMWEDNAAETKPTGLPLAGHSFAVKCLHVPEGQGIMYSGSDDGYVRQWDISTPTPAGINNAPFPLLCHREGVRCIAVSDEYLFTAGGPGGGIAIRYLDNGEIRHRFHVPGDTVTTMNMAKASNSLWAASTDGILHVWSLDDFTPIGSLNNHAASVVQCVKTIARSVESQLFLFSPSDGKLLQVNSQTDSFVDPSEDPSAEEREDRAQRTAERLKELRNQLMDNRSSLKQKEEEVAGIRRVEAHERKTAAAALMSQSALALKKSYLSKVLLWHQRHRNRSKQQIVAETLLSNTVRGMTYVFYSRLLKNAQHRIRRRHKQGMSDYILRATTKNLQLNYLKTALEYVNRRNHRTSTLQAAEAMMQHTEYGGRAVFFAKWARWRQRNRELVKRKIVAFSLMKTTERGSMVLHWNKLAAGAAAIRHQRMKNAAVEAMLSTTNRGRQLYILDRWRKHMQRQKTARRREVLMDTMSRGTMFGLARVYAGKWLALVRRKAEMTTAEKLAELKDANDKVEEQVNDTSIPSEKELDAMIAEAEKELAAANKGHKELEKEVVELETKETELRRRLAQSVNVDGSLPLHEQMGAISAILKPTALNCKKQLGVAVKIYQELNPPKKAGASETKPAAAPARRSSTPAASPRRGSAAPASPTGKKSTAASPKKEEEAKPAPSSPAEIKFTTAVQSYRTAMEELIAAIAPDSERNLKADDFWTLDAEATIQRATRKQLQPSLTAIREALIVWDHTQSGGPTPIEDNSKLKGPVTEFVQNATWSMEVLKKEKEYVSGASKPASANQPPSSSTDAEDKKEGDEAANENGAPAANADDDDIEEEEEDIPLLPGASEEEPKATSPSSSSTAKKDEPAGTKSKSTTSTTSKASPAASSSKKTSKTSSSTTAKPAAKPSAKKSSSTTATKKKEEPAAAKSKEKETAASKEEENKEEGATATATDADEKPKEEEEKPKEEEA